MRVPDGAVKIAREMWPALKGLGDSQVRARLRAEVRANSYPDELAKRKSSSIPLKIGAETARVIVRRRDIRGKGRELTIVAIVDVSAGTEAQIAARTAARRLRRTKAMAEANAHGA